MDFELSGIEKARLAAFIHTEEFKILDQLMKSEVFKFNTNLLNAMKPEDVITAHNLASAAAKFYQGLVNRINSEVYEYVNSPKPDDKPLDITEGILDIGGV